MKSCIGLFDEFYFYYLIEVFFSGSQRQLHEGLNGSQVKLNSVVNFLFFTSYRRVAVIGGLYGYILCVGLGIGWDEWMNEWSCDVDFDRFSFVFI